MARGEWQDTSCGSCGATIHYHISWDRIPDLCKDCIADRKAANAKWHETSCQDCGTTIKYHEDWDRVPDLCKPCLEARKAKWREKSCADCGTTIRYNVEWDNVPDLCKSCRDRRKAEWRETSCSKCGTTIKYNVNWSRIPDLCKPCIEIVKAEKAKWHEKSCLRCSATIKYHQDWERIPDYCRDCNTWQYKSCSAQGCGDEIRYKLYWDNVPEYCKPCKTGQRPISETRNRDDGGWDEYTGWGYVNRNGVIVFVDDGPNGKHSHAVYDADGNLVGRREEGHNEEWTDEKWQYTDCQDCGNSFRYDTTKGYVPPRCAGCRNKEPKLARHMESGGYGERMAESVATSPNGFNFDRTRYVPPYRGIDNIFRDGGNLVIVEAKSVEGYAPDALDNTIQGRQMSNDWIRNKAEIMVRSGVTENQALGQEILDRLNSGHGDSIRRILINADPRGRGEVQCFETFDPDARSWGDISPGLDE